MTEVKVVVVVVAVVVGEDTVVVVGEVTMVVVGEVTTVVQLRSGVASPTVSVAHFVIVGGSSSVVYGLDVPVQLVMYSGRAYLVVDGVTYTVVHVVVVQRLSWLAVDPWTTSKGSVALPQDPY